MYIVFISHSLRLGHTKIGLQEYVIMTIKGTISDFIPVTANELCSSDVEVSFETSKFQLQFQTQNCNCNKRLR